MLPYIFRFMGVTAGFTCFLLQRRKKSKIMLRKIKIHHWNNQDRNIRNLKKCHNIRQEKYKTHNNIDKAYRKHSYLLKYGNRRNGGEFVVLLKTMLKNNIRKRKHWMWKFINKKVHTLLSNLKYWHIKRIRFTGLSQWGQFGWASFWEFSRNQERRQKTWTGCLQHTMGFRCPFSSVATWQMMH